MKKLSITKKGYCFEVPFSMRIGYASDKQALIDGLAAVSSFLRILEGELLFGKTDIV